jgi:hypothetical protein
MRWSSEVSFVPPSRDPASFAHAVVVLTIIISASILSALGKVDSPTLSTVYGAAIGYASGLTVGRRDPRPPET